MTEIEKDIYEWTAKAYNPTLAGQFAKLSEEYGELVEAIIGKLMVKEPYQTAPTVSDVVSELADMAIVLSNIASMLGYSLSEEVAKKHAYNKTRPDHQPAGGVTS